MLLAMVTEPASGVHEMRQRPLSNELKLVVRRETGKE